MAVIAFSQCLGLKINAHNAQRGSYTVTAFGQVHYLRQILYYDCAQALLLTYCML